ncbi:uncharacterized protein RG961_012868 [Leptosomus discolor]
MSRGEGAVGTYEKWDFDEETKMEKQKPRKTPKGGSAALSVLASALERPVMLLYVLLAFTFLLFTVLTIISLQRVSAAWEALEQARTRSENSHTTAWRNLSEVQSTLDKQLSGGLKAINGRLANVSQEVESVRWKVTQCKAEWERELSERLRVLEEREPLEPVLRQLAEVKQEQSRVSALLNTALEQTRNLSGILCTTCPDGWQQFAKTCYFFSTTTKPWLAAKDFCIQFGAHLAIVNTKQENKFLASQIMQNEVAWLGLTDRHQEGNWQWVDGSSLTRAFWGNGEPNNVGQDGEDCATLHPNGFWNDALCSNAETWVCERSC